jgi:hypothetical protein
MCWRWRGSGLAVVAACSAVLAVPGVASAATVSLWQMDETSGSTMVDSVGANDGTLKNVMLGQPGFSGLAYGFNGKSSVVTVSSSSSLNPGSSPFWMTVHVKFTGVPTAAIGGDYDVIRKGLSGTSGGFYKMELMPDPGGTAVQAHCSMEGSVTSRSLTAEPNLADGSWHTVQCVKDDSSLSVVVDDVEHSVSVKLGSFGNSAPLAIGAKAEGGDWYEGLLDEVGFGLGEAVDVAIPSNAAPPTVSGTLAEGSLLSASTGSWNGTQPIAYAYQWQRCDAAGGHCADVLGATQSIYAQVAADEGHTLRVAVTATNSGGSRTATSAATGVVPVTSSGATPGGASNAPATPTLPAPPPTAATPADAGSRSCTASLSGTAVRRLRLHGGGTVTLRFDAATQVARLRGPRGAVRRVAFMLDGTRLRGARGGSLRATLRAAGLAPGAHALRAIVHPRQGRARTLVIRLTVRSC